MLTFETLGSNATLDELLGLIDPRIADAVHARIKELTETAEGWEAQNDETEGYLRDADKRVEELEETVSDLEDRIEELS